MKGYLQCRWHNSQRNFWNLTRAWRQHNCIVSNADGIYTSQLIWHVTLMSGAAWKIHSGDSWILPLRSANYKKHARVWAWHSRWWWFVTQNATPLNDSYRKPFPQTIGIVKSAFAAKCVTTPCKCLSNLPKAFRLVSSYWVRKAFERSDRYLTLYAMEKEALPFAVREFMIKC